MIMSTDPRRDAISCENGREAAPTVAQTRTTLHHYRDRDGREVDLILERPDGTVVGIEVKATSTPRDAHLAGLRYLAERLGPRFRFGVLLTLAPEATAFGPRLAALPVESLWRADEESAG